MTKAQLVGYTEDRRRVGQGHPMARVADADVDLIRALHEDPKEPMGYRLLARKFEMSKRTIRDICNYKRRVVTAVQYAPPVATPPPKQLTREDLKRRYRARRESLIQEISSECGLHRNTIAALAREVERPRVRKGKRRMAAEESVLLATKLE